MEWVVAYRASDVGVNGDRESLLGVGERLYDDSAETRLVGVAADAVDEAEATGAAPGLVRVRVVGDETTPKGRVEELQGSAPTRRRPSPRRCCTLCAGSVAGFSWWHRRWGTGPRSRSLRSPSCSVNHSAVRGRAVHRT